MSSTARLRSVAVRRPCIATARARLSTYTALPGASFHGESVEAMVQATVRGGALGCCIFAPPCHVPLLHRYPPVTQPALRCDLDRSPEFSPHSFRREGRLGMRPWRSEDHNLQRRCQFRRGKMLAVDWARGGRVREESYTGCTDAANPAGENLQTRIQKCGAWWQSCTRRSEQWRTWHSRGSFWWLWLPVAFQVQLMTSTRGFVIDV